ncbi:MAG: M28 family peptidase [Acidobacteria bacterium]|nr:M28 family peptidase [Acidobacteriota bacterium]
MTAGTVTLAALQTVAEQRDAVPPGAVHAITAERLMATVKALAAPEMEGRRTGTAGGHKARSWLVSAIEETGLSAIGSDYVLPFRFRSRNGEQTEGANIAATCPGADPSLPVIVVSAHYDHLGVRDGQIYPGADDNASGVATVLELARRCRRLPFQHTTFFVFFDAEEQGLQGARAFVSSPPIPRERLTLNVNLDMVARGDAGELYVSGLRHYPSLRGALEPVAARSNVRLLFGHDQATAGADDWTFQSDHGAFHEAKIPFVYFGVEDHADYHKPTDAPEKIDPVFFQRAAETILDALMALDRQLASRSGRPPSAFCFLCFVLIQPNPAFRT